MTQRSSTLTALTILAALLVTPGPSHAGADLSAEARTVDAYFAALSSYYKDAELLRKKFYTATLDAGEIRALTPAVDALKKKADALQAQLPSIDSALRGVATKLKAANEFSTLDASLAATTDAKVRTLFQQNSLQQLFDSPNLTSLSSEIGAAANALQAKLTNRDAQTVNYRTTLACRVGTARLGLINRRGGAVTDQTLDVVSCNCNPTTADGRTGQGLGTGRSCADVMAN